MRTAIIFGTRPEIIKLSRIISLAKNNSNFETTLIHTGQHYSYSMSGQFLDELKLPKIDINLDTGSGTHNYQLGTMLLKLEKVLKEKEIECVIVQGDTNSVLAGALCANRSGIKVGHVEAGIRSFDKTMPEEINRIITDSIADYCFAPTTTSVENLKKENILPDRIFNTGNTIVDAVKYYLPLAEKRKNVIKMKNYGLVTIHRPANVDDKNNLREYILTLNKIQEDYSLPLIFPVHPRTRKNMEEWGLLKDVKIQLTEPMGYYDFLKAMNNSKLIITDSGGLQEEACILGIPCVTVRDNTERPESVGVGANYLAGTNIGGLLKGVSTMLDKNQKWKQPFGDGKSSERILKILLEKE